MITEPKTTATNVKPTSGLTEKIIAFYKDSNAEIADRPVKSQVIMEAAGNEIQKLLKTARKIQNGPSVNAATGALMPLINENAIQPKDKRFEILAHEISKYGTASDVSALNYLLFEISGSSTAAFENQKYLNKLFSNLSKSQISADFPVEKYNAITNISESLKQVVEAQPKDSNEILLVKADTANALSYAQ